MNTSPKAERILAIDPFYRGFGFVVLEGADFPVHWGVKEKNKADSHWLQMRMRELIRRYEPGAFVFADLRGKRTMRINDGVAGYIGLTEASGMATVYIAEAEIAKSFGKATRREIAERLAERFPEMAETLPSKRKIWESEDPRVRVFRALTLAAVYYGWKPEQ